MGEARHSQGGTETTGPGCGVIPPCPVQGSARPIQHCLPWGWASPWGCGPAGASQLVAGGPHKPGAHAMALRSRLTFPPQPSSLKPFPTGRAWWFTEIPLAPFPELPCWRGTPVPPDARGIPEASSSPIPPWHIPHHPKSYHPLRGTPGMPTLPVSSRTHLPPALGSVGCSKHR